MGKLNLAAPAAEKEAPAELQLDGCKVTTTGAVMTDNQNPTSGRNVDGSYSWVTARDNEESIFAGETTFAILTGDTHESDGVTSQLCRYGDTDGTGVRVEYPDTLGNPEVLYLPLGAAAIMAHHISKRVGEASVAEVIESVLLMGLQDEAAAMGVVASVVRHNTR